MKIVRYVPENIMKLKLMSLLSKHVFNLNSPKAFRLMSESIKTGYEYSLWGVVKTHMQDFHYNMDIILKMEKENYCHPLRVVACRYAFSDRVYLWCDNMHSAIMYIRKYGADVTLKDIPFYIVYVNEGNVINICDCKEVVREDAVSLQGLSECSVKRFRRSDNIDLLNVGYTVEDFCKDNPEFLLYGRYNNGSIHLEDLRDKYIFWDIDGVLAPYRFNGHVSDPCGTDNGMSIKEIEEGVFLNRLPSRKMQELVCRCHAKQNIIMGHCLIQKEMDDKQLWLDKYYPSIKERLLTFCDIPKYKTILWYCSANNICLDEVIFVDDTVPILRETERNGIRSYHISSFLDLSI